MLRAQRQSAAFTAEVRFAGLADQPEARRLRAGRPAVARAGLLPDGVGDPAPLPHGDGAPAPGAADRPGRGRRDVRRWCRDRGRRPADRDQVDRRDRRSRSSTAKGFGRIRLQRVDDVSTGQLDPVHRQSAVEPGATVHTDGWQAYWTSARPAATSTSGPSCAERCTIPLTSVMPGVHRVASLTSSAGCSAPTKARSAPSTSTRTSTSSHSASTDATPAGAACFSTDYSSRRSSPTRSPTAA